MQPLRTIKETLGKLRSRKGPAGTVATIPDKAFQLLQAALGRIDLAAIAGNAATAAHMRSEVRAAPLHLPFLIPISTTSAAVTPHVPPASPCAQMRTVVDLLKRAAATQVQLCEAERQPLLAVALQVRRALNLAMWPDDGPAATLTQLVRRHHSVWHHLHCDSMRHCVEHSQAPPCRT